MKYFCFACLIASLIFSCNNSKTTAVQPSQLLPENYDLVLKINAFESLGNGFKNNDLLNALRDYGNIEAFADYLNPLQKLSNNKSLVSISKSSNDSLELCLIFRLTKASPILNSEYQVNPDNISDPSPLLSKIKVDQKTFYYRVIDSICFISNSKTLTTSAEAKNEISPEIADLMKLTDEQKMVSVLAKSNTLNLSSLLDVKELKEKKFSDYAIFDIEISQNKILWNGITKGTDSLGSTINMFRKLVPQANKIASVIPESASFFKSYTYDDHAALQTNLSQQFQIDSSSICSSLLQTINEVASTTIKNNKIVAINSIDPNATLDLLNVDTNALEFRGTSIYTLNMDNLSNCLFPLIKTEELSSFIMLDDFLIFAKDSELLELFISSYQNETVLAKSDHYNKLLNELSDESSLLIYMNSDKLNDLTNSIFTDDININISEYKSSAIQFIYDSDYAHINAAFTTHKNNRIRNTVSEEFNIKLDSDLIIAPQLVKNHKTNQMDIATQDINNNLYLISNTGKVFWKKQLDGKIMGTIHQIDTYKNGRLQLVFNTPNRLYVLDRNGKDVNAFPLKFNDKITQPISVFDYDNKKNYRLMITQGKSVLMYDKNGKIVSGFKYKSANNRISSQPKHFRIGRKDYIVFTEGNHIEILNRVGETRIDIKNNISFSDNEIYLYQNKFSTTNSNGELIQINTKGNLTSRNLQVNNDHQIATTSKTLVVLNENKLTIKSKTIDLDFGVYTSPKIFYINDKIYVTVTDLQSKKGFLFDSQAKTIANFPVYANSEIELNNVDQDSALEVVTKGDNNAIIVYELN